jgi:hypothetical protein
LDEIRARPPRRGFPCWNYRCAVVPESVHHQHILPSTCPILKYWTTIQRLKFRPSSCFPTRPRLFSAILIFPFAGDRREVVENPIPSSRSMQSIIQTRILSNLPPRQISFLFRRRLLHHPNPHRNLSNLQKRWLEQLLRRLNRSRRERRARYDKRFAHISEQSRSPLSLSPTTFQAFQTHCSNQERSPHHSGRTLWFRERC